MSITLQPQIGNAIRNSCAAQRCYSDKASDKSNRKRHDEDVDNDDDDDNKRGSKRTVPSLGEDVIIWPNFFKTLKNSWNIFYIRLFLDKQFHLMDFVMGTRQALQVPSICFTENDTFFDNVHSDLGDFTQTGRRRL